MERIQSLIDENKQQIPDGLYLQLCNETKKAHEAARFYRVKYVYSKVDNIDDKNITMSLVPAKAVLELSQLTYQNILRVIAENGCAHYCGFNETGKYFTYTFNDESFFLESECLIISIEPAN
jgi:hypothetical protein